MDQLVGFMFDQDGSYISDLGSPEDQTSINQAEELFGIDINGDNHQGRNVQIFDTAAYIASKNLTTFTGSSNTKTLFTDINSGELLFADSSNTDDQILLTNIDGYSFINPANHTSFDIEQASDGTIKLLAYREAGNVTKTITETISKRVKVGRKYKYVNQEVTREVTEYSEAGFVITTFDSFGQLVQETTTLNPADLATYDAEKLFGIDLNNDNHQGRNVQAFDTDAYTTANSITTFTGSSNTKTLFTDINSGELLFADSSNTDDQTLLTNKDGSSFFAGTSLTSVDIEQDSDGSIKLLAYREAGNVTKTITETISKRVKVGRKYKYVNQEVTREVTEYSEAGFVTVSYTHLTLPTRS